MYFFAFNLEIFHLAGNFYTDAVCGVCNKHEVCRGGGQNKTGDAKHSQAD